MTLQDVLGLAIILGGPLLLVAMMLIARHNDCIDGPPPW